MGAEIAGARGRRAARAVGGARRRVLRQGVRHYLSRPPAHEAAERAREADRFSLAAMFALAALCLLAGVFPGLFIDALAPAVQQPRRRPDADADRDRIGCRSCRSPRAAAPTTACSSSCSSLRRPRWPPPRSIGFASDAVRSAPAWDCGFPDAEPGDAIYRRQFRRADSPRVRRLRFPRARATSTCRRRATRGRRASTSRCTTSSGKPSTRRSSARSSRSPDAAQPAAVPDHPAVSQRRLRRAGTLLLVLAAWP